MTKRTEKILESVNKFIAYGVYAKGVSPKRVYLCKGDYEILRESMPKNMQKAYPNYYPYKGVKIKPLNGHRFPDEEE